MNYFKHPLSQVDSENIGLNSKIWQFVVVLKGAIIGNNTNICSHCFVENKVIIGNNGKEVKVNTINILRGHDQIDVDILELAQDT